MFRFRSLDDGNKLRQFGPMNRSCVCMMGLNDRWFLLSLGDGDRFTLNFR